MNILVYIDPGTGSMLFTIAIGIISACVFFLRALLIKLKFVMSGGKSKTDKNANKEDYVIFSDSKRYWNVFKPVCDEFERRQIKISYYTASPDDPALSEEYKFVNTEFIGEGNKAFSRLNMMKARVCLSTTPGLEVYQWKRSKDTDFYVHIYHAVDEGLGYRMFGVDFYDAILLTGEFQEDNIRKLEKLRSLPAKETCVTGSTYLDSMKKRLDEAQAEGDSASKTEGSLEASGVKTVLLAPSWGESSILNRYGESILSALAATGFNIVVRPHPQMAISDAGLLNELKEKYPENDRFKWNSDNDNFECLRNADVMITDFSGIIFDYCLVFNRPLIYADTSMDLSPYDASWIDEPLWRLEILPKLGIKLNKDDFGDMRSIIDSLSESDEYRNGREEIRNTAWQYIGESATKTVDYLVKKCTEIKDKEQ